MEPHESSSDPVKTLRPRLLFINELNCLTEVAGQFTGSPANKSRQIWDEITVQNTTLYFEFIKVFELSSFDNMTLSRSSRSSSCKTLSFKVFYYLFLSRCVCACVFVFFPLSNTRARDSICLYHFRFGASGWQFSYKGTEAGQSIAAVLFRPDRWMWVISRRLRQPVVDEMAEGWELVKHPISYVV